VVIDPARELLRHTVATLAYRAGKALRDVPDGFSDFRIAAGSRSAGEILAHMCDLFDWALSIAESDEHWKNVPPQTWPADCVRFFSALEKFDACLAHRVALGGPIEQLFQGPIADALTHTGQLTMMRRLAGAPVRGENYARATITRGRVGASQEGSRGEFD
jgi:hypothetical protein